MGFGGRQVRARNLGADPHAAAVSRRTAAMPGCGHSWATLVVGAIEVHVARRECRRRAAARRRGQHDPFETVVMVIGDDRDVA